MPPARCSILLFLLALRSVQLEVQLRRERFPEFGLGVSITRHGLANRLRVLASAAQLARFAEVPLFVHWAPSRECNASYWDLFEVESLQSPLVYAGPSDGKFLLFTEERNSLQGAAALVNSTSPRASLSSGAVEVFWLQSKWISEEILALLHRKQSFVVIVTGSLAFRIKDVNCIDYYLDKSRLYSGLQPSPQVRDLYDHAEARLRILTLRARGSLDTTDGIAPNFTIGLHIRKSDNRYDWSLVPLETSVVSFEIIAPVETFRELIAQMHAGHASSVFFLASNDRHLRTELQRQLAHIPIFVQEDLLDSFGPCALSDMQMSFDPAQVQARFEDRSNVCSMQLAVVDWLLLARNSDVVAHSFGSSFGEEAVLARLKPSIKVRTDGNVYGIDTALPLCNDMMLLDDLLNGDSTGVAESAIDGKRPVELLDCSAIGDIYGASNLYC